MTYDPRPAPFWIAGAVVAVAGAALFAAAVRALGSNLTPLPVPKPGAGLVTHGPFTLVRHPIYLGVVLVVAGCTLPISTPALASTAALALLWAFKLRVEERHLAARFPEYEAYRRRVRWRLLPFVY